MVAHSQEDSVSVSWTAPGDDGRSGTATAYDLRISEAPITEANFATAFSVPAVPAPAASGTRQRVTVRGLTRGTTYYFAIRTVDDAGNWSGLSNLLRWDWIIDTAPPGAPATVAARREGDHVRITWSPNSEPDVSGYRVYRWFTESNDPLAATITPVGTVSEFVDAEIPAGTEIVWYRVSALDGSGNESALSSGVLVTLVNLTTQVTVESPYPNPSRGDAPVSIPVVTPPGANGAAIVDVVNGGGHRVRRLEVTLSPGRQVVVWDGRNDAGRAVVPGVYRAWLIAGETRTSIRLLRVP
jgi:hypothetical protein